MKVFGEPILVFIGDPGNFRCSQGCTGIRGKVHTTRIIRINGNWMALHSAAAGTTND